jgi:hypothetical protein
MEEKLHVWKLQQTLNQQTHLYDDEHIRHVLMAAWGLREELKYVPVSVYNGYGLF